MHRFAVGGISMLPTATVERVPGATDCAEHAARISLTGRA